MARFLTGTRAEVLRRMAQHAIRDQRALADAYRVNDRGEVPDDAAKVIDDCRRNIADYRRFIGTKNGGAA